MKARHHISKTTAAAILTLAALCCGGSITYSPEADKAALDRMSKTWSTTYGEKPFAITVCEDKEANATFDVDGCKYAHLVRSMDPSKEETVDRASGCESCFLGILTNVTATLNDPAGKAVQLKGIVSLGTESSEDPYDGDFALLLYKGDKIYLEGRIQKDGTLVLSGDDLYGMGFEVDEAEEKLETFADGACGQESPGGDTDAGEPVDAGEGEDDAGEVEDGGAEDVDAGEGDDDGGADAGEESGSDASLPEDDAGESDAGEDSDSGDETETDADASLDDDGGDDEDDAGDESDDGADDAEEGAEEPSGESGEGDDSEGE